MAAGLATLFGPGEPIGGVDLGATGAGVFSLTLVGAIVLFARRAHEVFPEDASVAEQRAWIGALFIGFVLLDYLRFMWAVWQLPEPPSTPAAVYAQEFLRRLFILIIVWETISHLIGRRAGEIQTDERDLRLKNVSARAGGLSLTAIIVACVCVLALTPAPLLAWWLSPIVLANVLIGLLIARSLVEHVVLTMAYFAARR
jgi:Na+-transporting methylmalonyl-CoA/oxaloacetate decarboxylase gamma subunit